MNINTNYGINSIYSTLFQGNIAMHNNKMNKGLFPFPDNKAQGLGALGGSGVQYVSNIKSASKELGGALKDLSGSAFSQRTMNSSNKDILTVDYTGNRASSLNPMTVKVDQTAAGQLNEGTRMNAAETYGGNGGTNRFSIETGGKTTQLSVNVAAGDTNKDVQQKMADAINKAGIGVKATVETDKTSNSSILKLESVKTGSDPKNSFTIQDITGNIAARTGANDLSSEGRDAIYSVNGGPTKTSQSNTVNLGNGINATFNKASDETVTISRGQDLKYAMSAVQNMVSSYNNLFSEAAQKTGDPKAQNLASKMVNISSTYSKSLSNVGIGFTNDGKMTIDTQKLNQAAENGKLQQFFTENSGKSYGFTNQLGRLADNVSRNTSNFVSSSMFGNNLGENFSYSRFGDLLQYNYLGAGSLLDFML